METRKASQHSVIQHLDIRQSYVWRACRWRSNPQGRRFNVDLREEMDGELSLNDVRGVPYWDDRACWQFRELYSEGEPGNRGAWILVQIPPSEVHWQLSITIPSFSSKFHHVIHLITAWINRWIHKRRVLHALFIEREKNKWNLSN